jgi:hypothetical protein
MNSVERISTLIPKFKQQLIFLEEREKLFKKIDDYSIQCDNVLSNVSTNYQPLATASTNTQASSTVSINSQSSSFICANTTTIDHLSDVCINDSAADRLDLDAAINTSFPDDYKIPLLLNSLIKDIEDGIVAKFGPHCSNRRILIDAIVYDLIDKYNLL